MADEVRQRHGSRANHSVFPPANPIGWFQVAESQELAEGQVVSLDCFDTQLVLFRTASGSAHVLDAHCPHLGAHLGFGGEVEGEAIKCPFHGHCYDGRGNCVKIPRAEKIPPLDRTRSWPVVERSGMIFMYHDPLGRDPSWQVPEFPWHDDPEWTPFERAASAVIDGHVQDIVENTVDVAHFQPVHGTPIVWCGVEARGPLFTTHLGVKPEQSKIDSWCHGLGCTLSQTSSLRSITTQTPLANRKLHLRSYFSIQRGDPTTLEERRAARYKFQSEEVFGRDLVIWGNKTWRARPPLCSADGPIAEYRRWCRQFYPELESQNPEDRR